MHLIITGADGALGSAVVARHVEAGDRVAALHGAAPADPSSGRFAAGDLADEANARDVMAQAARWLGTVDALIHLVGGFQWATTATTTLADWRAMFDANIATAVASVNAALPYFSDGGAIVLIGAVSAQPAKAGFGPYGAAKAGVARLTEALAAELAPRGIRVNAALPSIIDTPRNRADMPDVDPASWTTPAAVADTIAFLASPAARGVTGALLPVTNPA
ncbi:SDR family oxidoreductase [Sphingomonas sp. BT-65]|uniref:SDR family oxidoreductase n=1 Tax=Sphingomonas sp. BT-65 TaxID=2989821 RepID=UPI00223680EF|nr:SDR family oxidoreductase [Sphingomonas sp. BT-65]MCW4460910.1 SDR family oxidoreductase [Sphingomonas sp. BT-65]